jgi:hypothetical protein
MHTPRWVARLRPDRRGYHLLRRGVWYDVIDNTELGCVVRIWDKPVFIFSQDAEFKLLDPVEAGPIG